MAEAYSAWENITKAFLKENKRTEKVELTIASSGQPEKKKVFGFVTNQPKQPYEIRCHFNEADRAEMEWFRGKLNK